MKVLIIYASAGAGHRKAAEALYKSFEQSVIKDLSVTKIDALDYTTALFKKSYPSVYIFLVTYVPFIWGLFYHFLNYRPFIPIIRHVRHFFNAIQGKALIEYVKKENPDVVICEHFFSAELISYLKTKLLYKGVVICGVTDFGVHQFWINPGTDYYLAACQKTKEELIEKGIAQEKIIITGIPIEEKFSNRLLQEKIRVQLGLATDKFTVLVTSGGFGVGPIEEIVRILDKLDEDIQIAVVCGKNERLCQMLKNGSYSKTVKIFGYVHNMDAFMEAADVIVTKSGGLTVSESLAKALPMIIMKPIPGQETSNAEIIEMYNIGFRLMEVKDIGAYIKRLLANDSKLLKEMKENAQKLAKPQAARETCLWIIENFVLKK